MIYKSVILLEPDLRKHYQLPVAQVSHGSRDELEVPQITLVETPGSKDELEAQTTLVHMPSLYLVSVGLNSSEYPRSAPTDKQWPFHVIT